MLKRFRLRHKADFERLLSEGKRWHHSLAVLIVRPNELGINRFGFRASKRVGRAVDRNYAKRRFREAVRRRMGEVRPGWDCLFIIKPKSRKASSREIEDAVNGMLDQAGLIIGSESEDRVGYLSY
jgi:ribonuclease P protein component